MNNILNSNNNNISNFYQMLNKEYLRSKLLIKLVNNHSVLFNYLNQIKIILARLKTNHNQLNNK